MFCCGRGDVVALGRWSVSSWVAVADWDVWVWRLLGSVGWFGG